MSVINKLGLQTLIDRETKLRDAMPEHTLDWYTYNNKVELLKEVDALIEPEGIPTNSVVEGNLTDTKEIAPVKVAKSSKSK